MANLFRHLLPQLQPVPRLRLRLLLLRLQPKDAASATFQP
jgi:hypothetical protein